MIYNIDYSESCIDCGITLTEIEQWAYIYRCEDCEQAWMKRLDDWMAGGEDEELDALFGGAPREDNT